MSKEVVIQLRDDMTGDLGADVATRPFAFAGVNYEIELNDDNFEDFRLDIKKWIDAARVVRKKRKLAASNSKPAPPPTSIREWARDNGYQVGTRGGLSKEVRDAFAATYPRRQKGH